jgi:hypothetical protein
MSISGDTYIATINGPKKVEDISIGDELYCYDNGNVVKNTIISIKKSFLPGKILKYYNYILGCFTENHEFLAVDSRYLIKRNKSILSFNKHSFILRVILENNEYGNHNEPHAYAIGALLGDGCSTYLGKQIYVSSQDALIPTRIKEILNAKFLRKQNGGNYTYVISNEDAGFKGGNIGGREVVCNNYKEWCKGRKAHQKISDIKIIKTWNKFSCVKFLAGVFDTDGHVTIAKNRITIGWGMQARSVIESIQHIVFLFWQHYPTIMMNDGKHYVNGPVYDVKVRNNLFSRKILKEMSPFLVCEYKKYKPEMDFMNGKTNPDYLQPRIFDGGYKEMYDLILDNNSSKIILSIQGAITNCSS